MQTGKSQMKLTDPHLGLICRNWMRIVQDLRIQAAGRSQQEPDLFSGETPDILERRQHYGIIGWRRKIHGSNR